MIYQVHRILSDLGDIHTEKIKNINEECVSFTYNSKLYGKYDDFNNNLLKWKLFSKLDFLTYYPKIK